MTRKITKRNPSVLPVGTAGMDELLHDVRRLIEETRRQTAAAVNAGLTGDEIVVSQIRQLSWTHFIALIPLKDTLQRDFYAEMCRVQRWSVRQLRQQIDSMLYERTALSQKPEAVVEARSTRR